MFELTIAIVIALFIFDVTLSILNYRYRNQPIPENVSDVYEPSEYKKWLDYTMELFRVSIITKTVNTVVLLAFLLAGFFPMLDEFAKGISTYVVTNTLLFFGAYMLINYIIGIGFNIYKTFVIEEKYGFNTTTTNTFVGDQIKGIILTAGLGGALLYPLILLYDKFGNISLIYSWCIVMAVFLLINILYTKVFIKMFNKITPLEEGELADKTIELAESMGYGIKKISVMDASKRSTRLNAFFSGFGKFKDIILFDTLINKCTTDEILSVLAHEIGHSKQKDVLKNVIIMAVQLAGYMAILSFFLSSTATSEAFGFESVNYGFAIILFGILFKPFGILLGIPLTALSRKAEYGADKHAADAGYKDAMVSALKLLAKENFANLTPHPAVVALTYSHPPITQRIAALDKK